MIPHVYYLVTSFKRLPLNIASVVKGLYPQNHALFTLFERTTNMLFISPENSCLFVIDET